jgi:hypothetical protein
VPGKGKAAAAAARFAICHARRTEPLDKATPCGGALNCLEACLALS